MANQLQSTSDDDATKNSGSAIRGAGFGNILPETNVNSPFVAGAAVTNNNQVSQIVAGNNVTTDPNSTNPTDVIPSSIAGVSNSTSSNENTNSIIPYGRLYNPLGGLSSYTYQLSLYMVSPDGYNNFIANGPKGLLRNAGVLLVAQSGGINTQQSNPTFIQRALPYDYFIDNFSCKILSPAKAGGAINTLEYTFEIIEPTGFNFLDSLVEAEAQLQNTSQQQVALNAKTQVLQQVFIMGIRFYGYDAAGKLVPNSDYKDADTVDNLDTQAIFERYYTIKIQNLTYALNGNLVRYKVTAISFPQHHVTTEYCIKSTFTCSGSTLKDALTKDFADKLTKSQPDSVDLGNNATAKTIPDKYEVIIEDDEIANSKFGNDDEYSYYRSPGVSIDNSNQSTVANGNQPPKKETKFHCNGGTSILSQLDQIIRQSKYVTDAFTQYNTISASNTSVTNTPNKEISWYVITPEVKIREFDPVRNTYAKTITYRIKRYLVPYIATVRNYKKQIYYGPTKRYDYWFTGKNTEIINFEQNFNLRYYIAASITNGKLPPTDKLATHRVQFQNGVMVPSESDAPNRQGAFAAEAASSIYSPADQVTARLTILGDPDYLDQTLEGVQQANLVFTSRNSAGKTADQAALRNFYGSNFTMSFNNGQVFIEISFKEGKDYNETTVNGLKEINSDIRFSNYPQKLQDRQAVIYKVNSATANFSGGKFTIVLELINAPFKAYPEEGQSPNQRSETSSAVTTKTTTTRAGQTVKRTTKKSPTSQTFPVNEQIGAKVTKASDAKSLRTLLNANSSANTNKVTSPTGKSGSSVVDDDGSRSAPYGVAYDEIATGSFRR